jgi:hypothetical protein
MEAKNEFKISASVFAKRSQLDSKAPCSNNPPGAIGKRPASPERKAANRRLLEKCLR